MFMIDFRHVAPIILAAAMAQGSVTQAQEVGLKTNLLNDAFLSPNIGMEVGLAPRWTFEVVGQLNGWSIGGHTWKHWYVQPEARYWFCQRFGGHFMGLHLIGGQYNFGHLGTNLNFLGSDFRNLNTNRYQGWGAGAGIAYGYAWPVARHWNVEAEIGLGWIYTRFDQYPCAECGTKIRDNAAHNYVGPTKASLNIVYLF